MKAILVTIMLFGCISASLGQEQDSLTWINQQLEKYQLQDPRPDKSKPNFVNKYQIRFNNDSLVVENTKDMLWKEEQRMLVTKRSFKFVEIGAVYFNTIQNFLSFVVQAKGGLGGLYADKISMPLKNTISSNEKNLIRSALVHLIEAKTGKPLTTAL